MIPGRAILGRLKFVREGLPRSDRTLSYTWYTIVLSVVQLTNSVPMYRRSIDFKVISNVDNQIVTPVCNDCWSWYGPVECQDVTLITIWCGGDVLG